MDEELYPRWQKGVVGLALAFLALLFIRWVGKSGGMSVFELLAGMISLALFIALGLRFVPVLFDFLFPRKREKLSPNRPLHTAPIFFLALFWAAAHYLLVYGILHYVNHDLTARDYLDFWRSADAYHYICIARDWYLSEGELDRLVQLVFLPGFPLVLRVFHALLGDYILSGLVCSTLCFCAALCVFYRLALLDFDEASARRAVVLVLLQPGVFFFFAPMSESLFLLLSVLCVYCSRRKRWWLAGVIGAYAAFTRSLGLMLFVPVFLELVRDQLPAKKKQYMLFAAPLLIPLGFAAYCAVNYAVAGNPFQFMIYQREHWYQSIGCFFATPAYQLRYALSAAAAHDSKALFGLWIPNLLSETAALVLMLLGARRLRASYTAWAIAYYVIAIGATWLLSAPRYMLCLPPLVLSLTACTERRAFRYGLLPLLLASNLAYLVLFTLRWNVW